MQSNLLTNEQWHLHVLFCRAFGGNPKTNSSRCYVKNVFLVADKAVRLMCSYIDKYLL